MGENDTNSVSCRLIIKHYNSFTTSTNIADLEIISGQTTQKLPDDKLKAEDLKEGLDKEMNFTMGDVVFDRKIYQPNEIRTTVKIQPYNDKDNSKTGTLPDLETIRKMFLNKPAELTIEIKDSSSSIPSLHATGYYVHDIKPKYKQQSAATEVEVALTIKSLDNLMTLNKYSQAYLARKFKGEILESVNRFNLTYPNSSLLSDDQKEVLTLQLNKDLNLQHLFYDKDTDSSQKEFIQPYLVQYNESFYDFIRRVANRCGEFLYFEDGKVCLGLGMQIDATEKNTSTVDYIDLKTSDYSEVVFQSINDSSPLQVKDYARDSLKDEFKGFASDDPDKSITDPTSNFPNNVPSETYGNRIYKEFGREEELKFPSDTELGKFPTGSDPYDDYYYNSEISADEYFMPLYKGGWASSVFTKNMAELNRGSKEKHEAHVVAQILAATNLIDLIVTLSAEYAELGLITLKYKDVRNDRAKERFIKPYSMTLSTNAGAGNNYVTEPAHVVPFSEDVSKRWTTLNYFSDIRKNEEQLQRGMVEITFEEGSFRNLKLGQIIRLSDISKTTLYVVVEININKSAKSLQIVKAIPLLLDSSNKYRAYPPVIKEEVFRYSGPQTAFVVDAADPKHQGRVRIRYPWQTNAEVIPTETFTAPDPESTTDKSLKEKYTKISQLISDYKKEKTEAASPWIRMSVPASSSSGGIYFEPEPGDEVLVDFENGNIERPYVIGALYSKNNPAPVVKGRRVIKSKFGHTLRFKDPSDGVSEITDSTGTQRAFGQLTPLFDMVSLWTAKDIFGSSKSCDPLTGGIDLGDQMGIYNISMSSDERAIKISSPFGDVSLNAFTGITISAPNGNIKISGKNVDIEASNKVSISSGSNLSRENWYESLGLGNVTSPLDLFTKGVEQLRDRYMIVNLGLLRSLVEIIVRPIDGTLKIKSESFVKIEAGEGEAEVHKDNYRPFYKNHWLDEKYPENITAQNIVDLSTVIGKYIDQVIEVVKNRANIQTRNTIQEIKGKIESFLIKYVKPGYLENVKTYDDLINSLFSDRYEPERVLKLCFKGQAYNIFNKIIPFVPPQNIERDYQDLWDKFNHPETSLKRIITLNTYTDFNNFTTDQGIVDNLKADIRHAYLNNELLFGRIQKYLNVNEARVLFNPTSRIINTDWDTEAQSLIRTLVLGIFNQTFFKTNFPQFQLDFDQPRDPGDHSEWINAITNMDITVIPAPGPSTDSQVLTYLAKNVFGDVRDFLEGLTMWKDGRAVKGKILLSEKKDTTLEFDDKGVLNRQRNHTIDIEETTTDLLNEIKTKLLSL